VSNVGSAVGVAASAGATGKSAPGAAELISRLRPIAIRSLRRMYAPQEKLFVFRLRRQSGVVVRQGLSPRYTAITLIGLAEADDSVRASILGEHSLHDVCERLKQEAERSQNLGDVALITWAAQAVGYPDRRWAWQKLMSLRPHDAGHPTVEAAWTLAALCVDREAPCARQREQLAQRLLGSFSRRAHVFPHLLGDQGKGLRAHVACFADQVYPIHALSHYFMLAGERAALQAAEACAGQICRLQGDAGQWWWHYDYRTGDVVEGYPVYAIHQDAMAPMALFALRQAGGADFSKELEKGLAWLEGCPELGGGSLIDVDADLVWRKVARREPAKLSRALQAGASRLHSALRVPGTDVAFPATAVDYEDRPYHLGWLFYAWRENHRQP
jgi:hypothetical protein